MSLPSRTLGGGGFVNQFGQRERAKRATLPDGLKINSALTWLGMLVKPDAEMKMRDDQLKFLTLLGQLPVRLTAEQAAWVLNCQAHDVPALVAARLLKPLGNPAPNSIKFFATSDVLELSRDRSWLAKITNTVNQHWQKKNALQRKRHASDSLSASPPMLNLPAAVNQ